MLRNKNSYFMDLLTNPKESTTKREREAEAVWNNRYKVKQSPVTPGTRNELHNLAAMHWADDRDSQSAIELLEKGMDLHQRDSQGKTPLCLAAYNGHVNLVLTFLSWGAKVNVSDLAGYSPRFYKMNYTCDHEYDPDACIPLKRTMDISKRELLAKLEKLEKKHLSAANPFYNFSEIKDKMIKLISTIGDSKPAAAICGYIVNNLPEEQRKEAFLTLSNSYKESYGAELTGDALYRSLPEDYFKQSLSFTK